MSKELIEILKWAKSFLSSKGNFVLAVVGNKGGIGKTLFSYNLLYFLIKFLGIPTVLIDCDTDQYSSAEFSADRKAANIKPDLPVVNCRTEELEKIILALSKKYRFIIVEFGKANDDKEEKYRVRALELAVKLADKVVMPLQPTPPDVKTVRKVEAKLPLNTIKVPTIIVPNRVKTKSQLENNLLAIAPYFKYFKVSKSFINDRLCYQDAFGLDGRSVFEINGSEPKKAHLELNQLFKEILCQENL